jgi:uncharacterized RmlC-like cupin family protein
MRILITLGIILFGSTIIASAHAGEDIIINSEIIVIQSPEELRSKQNLPYFHGISSESAGSKVLSMNLVIIPPGAQADAHYHDGFESAVYLIQGKVETRYGRRLEKTVVNQAGDFIFIPPNVPHQPRNLSQTDPAIAVVTRNDPNEQESVVPYFLSD